MTTAESKNVPTHPDKHLHRVYDGYYTFQLNLDDDQASCTRIGWALNTRDRLAFGIVTKPLAAQDHVYALIEEAACSLNVKQAIIKRRLQSGKIVSWR